MGLVDGCARAGLESTYPLPPTHHASRTGGRDPYLRVWSLDGKPIQTVDLVAGNTGVHVSGMDFHPTLGMLLCSCLNPSTRAVQMAGEGGGGGGCGRGGPRAVPCCVHLQQRAALGCIPLAEEAVGCW